MDIAVLLNDEEVTCADWDFELSDSEDEEAGVDVSDSETSSGALPSAGRRTGNGYVDRIIRDSGLHIVREREVKTAYNERGELGLFSLLFTREFRDSLQSWTNKMLEDKGIPEATVCELDAYIGLEIALSFNPVTEIKEMWSQKLFMGQSNFVATMARNRFERIRDRFQVPAPGSVPVDRREQDPLWHSRRLMAQIHQKFAAVAVPVGACAHKNEVFGEDVHAIKPDKYGVRFYSVVGWESLYAYSVWDNGSGNHTETTAAERNVDIFPALGTALFRTLERDDVSIKRKDASALWQCAATLLKTYPAPNQHRLLVCDNFYTRHNLAKTLATFTDGEMKMLGTVRIALQEKWMAERLEASKERIDNAERGSWELLAALDVPADWEKLQEKHKRTQKSFQHTFKRLASNAGYIVFRDKKTVVFYTNDLAGTPSQDVLPGHSQEAIQLCCGLAPLQRWTGDQVMHRKTFQVPAMIVAYNLFMNGVDRVDQLRSTNPIRRKERHLSISILTWALDLALINAFSLFRKVVGDASARVSLREFKRRVAEKLTERGGKRNVV
ncbi:LOW QUALITY PROTEIN: Hypothetical protein PHPALM_7578 [Phytophthora palmivora]|uniref:PiggyBac transposable element-derived protein domain-containing protein n=1 Tax=Phytophthora palmivora TaxID=4796 RepID=A0A2P4YC01_9STRA|nr:LOW QUALITY PROTEIN: Hypothetical protein PHPALM_7578 [Phytophthora palmivora]